ncbi:hypothetical protein YPPY47_1921, partial [Yersinia pestis PY-47]
MPKWQGGAVGV